MKVQCSSCSKDINIPDEKVPKDQAFNLTCPACKTKNRIDQHLKKEEPQPPEEPISDTDTMFMVTDEDFEDDEPMEIYDEHDKIALVMDQKNEDEINKALTDLGYKLQTARTPDHGVHKMKFTEFHVVVFHERFGGVDREENPLYKFIQDLPMTTRRKTFISMVGPELKSTDNMQAYAYSVNQVINEKDMDKLDVILKKGINENDMFYRIYKETMVALGKV